MRVDLIGTAILILCAVAASAFLLTFPSHVSMATAQEPVQTESISTALEMPIPATFLNEGIGATRSMECPFCRNKTSPIAHKFVHESQSGDYLRECGEDDTICHFESDRGGTCTGKHDPCSGDPDFAMQVYDIVQKNDLALLEAVLTDVGPTTITWTHGSHPGIQVWDCDGTLEAHFPIPTLEMRRFLAFRVTALAVED